MSLVRSRYRGVVFDLDGTLLDSMPQVLDAMASAVEPFRPRPEPAEMMDILGGPSEACLLRLLGRAEHLAAAQAGFDEFFRRHAELARPFSGVRELLADLRAAQLPVGLWTGRERAWTEAGLKALALDGFFDVLACGDDLASHKPDPAGLLQIIQRWRLAPGEVLFVGDSDQDLAGSRAAGVPMVAIQHNRRIAPELLRHPLAVLATPEEACVWVRAALLGKN